MVINIIPPTINGRITLMAVMIQAIVVIIVESLVANQFITTVDVTAPGPARGVPVYLVIFLLAQVFQVILCWDAVLKQNIMQIGSFVMFNAAIFFYSIFQYAQLISISKEDKSLSIPLIVIPIVVGFFEVVFSIMASKLYVEFGWRIFKRIGADPQMRNMFRAYEIFILLLKIDVFFIAGFCIQFVVLVIDKNDPEFALTIAALPIMLAFLTSAAYGMRQENFVIVMVFMGGLVLAVAYFVFKLYRIYTQPEKYSDTKNFLTFFAALSLAVVIATFVIAVICVRNFGRGLKSLLLSTNNVNNPTEERQVERFEME